MKKLLIIFTTLLVFGATASIIVAHGNNKSPNLDFKDNWKENKRDESDFLLNKIYNKLNNFNVYWDYLR